MCRVCWGREVQYDPRKVLKLKQLLLRSFELWLLYGDYLARHKLGGLSGGKVSVAISQVIHIPTSAGLKDVSVSYSMEFSLDSIF